MIVPRWIVCPDCDGTGDASIGDWRISAGWCPTCDGATRIQDRRQGRTVYELSAGLLGIVIVALICSANWFAIGFGLGRAFRG